MIRSDRGLQFGPMVKIEEINDDVVDLRGRFDDLLRRMKARNFESETDSNQGELDEVADTVCTALRK